MGAFKFRGAYNALSRAHAEERARGVVAFSSGNHAQAVALAGRLLGAPVTIVMPADAPAVKRAATEGYGARRGALRPRAREAAKRSPRASGRERGLALIPPYDHADVIAGQGTAATELIEEAGPLDVLLVPCGGGGLLSGSALAARRAGARLPRGRRRARGGRRRHALVPHRRAADRAQPAHHRRRRAHAVARHAHVPAGAAPTWTTWSR